MSAPATGRPGTERPSVLRARALTALTAVVVAVLIWVVAVPLAGVDLVVAGRTEGTTMELGIAPVLFVSALVALLGWALLTVLERFLSRARTVWVSIAAVVLLLSFAPLTGPDLSTATRVVLALLHLGVGLVLLVGYARTSHRR